MLEQYRLYASSTKVASLANNLKLANTVQRIFSKQIEVANIAPLKINQQSDFTEEINALIHSGFMIHHHNALNDLHSTLFLLYEELLKPVELSNEMQFHPGLIWLRNEIEKSWLKFELNNISNIEQNLFATSDEFKQSFNHCWTNHRYLKHPFHSFVKTEANRTQLEQLFITESVCASRFADMVSFALPGIPRIDTVVSEVMENLTDELISFDGISHKNLYAQLLEFLEIPIPSHPLDVLLPYGWRAIRGLNLFMHNAIHRRNYYKMMGAIGAGELTFPFFCHNVFEGAKRNHILNEKALMYHSHHSTLDVEHGEHWLQKVLIPLLSLSPKVGTEILLGLELQLTVTSEYYDALYEHWQESSKEMELSVSAFD
jgi:hypothetical protein